MWASMCTLALGPGSVGAGFNGEVRIEESEKI
jgi:hypothetical protein